MYTTIARTRRRRYKGIGCMIGQSCLLALSHLHNSSSMNNKRTRFRKKRQMSRRRYVGAAVSDRVLLLVGFAIIIDVLCSTLQSGAINRYSSYTPVYKKKERTMYTTRACRHSAASVFVCLVPSCRASSTSLCNAPSRQMDSGSI